MAAACSAIATPILLLLFDGDTGRMSSLIETLTDLGVPIGAAVFTANLMTSAADKLISGFIILTALAALTRHVTIPGGELFLALGSAGSRAPSTIPPLPVSAGRAAGPQ